jgi:hypothetical protein
VEKFYLSSHDFGVDPRPRECELLARVSGMHSKADYLLVKIEPALATRFWDGPISDFDRVFLAIAGNRTEWDIGRSNVMADIVICPAYCQGNLDELKCSRIGVGSLHASYSDALKSSPLEIEHE